MDETRLTPWLERAKGVLEGLSEKSFSTEMYFLSSAASSPTGEVPTPAGSQNEEEHQEQLISPTPSIILDTPQGNNRDGEPQESATQRESQSPTEVSGFHPASGDSATHTSQGLHLLGQLKDCNDTLSPHSRTLEMAKAELGAGTHAHLYRAVRDPLQAKAPLRDPGKIQPGTSASNGTDARWYLSSGTPALGVPEDQLQPERARHPFRRRRLSRVMEKIEDTETEETEDISDHDFQSTLWDKVEAAALADPEKLPTLLRDLKGRTQSFSSLYREFVLMAQISGLAFIVNATSQSWIRWAWISG